eukprot:15366481-Ditylum_brightwellii.AAC.2
MHPELHQLGNKYFSKKKKKRVIRYAVCTLQYFSSVQKAEKETKAGVVYFKCARYNNKGGLEGKVKNKPRLCYNTWDCHNIYLVANKVNLLFYNRQGFKLMCKIKKDKANDWDEVKGEDFSLAMTCLCLVPGASVNKANLLILKSKYVYMMRACVGEFVKNLIVPDEKHLQQLAIDAFMKDFAWMQLHGASGDIMYGHYIGKDAVLPSLLFQNKVLKALEVDKKAQCQKVNLGIPTHYFDASQKPVACGELKDHHTCEAESLKAITETTRKMSEEGPRERCSSF